ncbi:MAG: FecR domain-containing protein [Burkholderiales bacterium]
MKTTSLAIALVALCPCALLQAASNAVVEAVQYPAWLERDGQAVPLSPGMQLQARDRLRTGANARVQMKLGEGSTVKLGEGARFTIEKAESGGVFRASLAVATGAFRFTTDPQSKAAREVSIQVKNVTAGVRGTDLWGKSTDERDLVCLLEGKITVGAQGHPTLTLDQPLDFYQKPRDASPSVDKVPAEKIKEWAQETELAAEGPVARVDGRWRVIAATFRSRDEALGLNRALRTSGYPAEVVAAEAGREFLVQVPGLAGETQARALMAGLRGVKGAELPSVRTMP